MTKQFWGTNWQSPPKHPEIVQQEQQGRTEISAFGDGVASPRGRASRLRRPGGDRRPGP